MNWYKKANKLEVIEEDRDSPYGNYSEIGHSWFHGVPREAIERMVNRFEDNITVEDILNDEK